MAIPMCLIMMAVTMFTPKHRGSMASRGRGRGRGEGRGRKKEREREG
jgi:hypothetical protein